MHCQTLFHYSVCQPVHCTCVLFYYAVELYFLLIFTVNLCLKILVVNLYYNVHGCTVHARSVVNYACVMFCLCPPPIFKMYLSEILYETESSSLIMLSELKMSGQ